MAEDQELIPAGEQEHMAEITRGRTQLEDPALEEARNQLARMIALRGHDPSLVEDDIFRSFVGSLNPRFTVPSRRDVEEMCDGVFADARQGFFRRNLPILWNRPISIAVGKAKTMEKQVLCVSCHFIDDEWNLHRFIKDAFVESHDPCAGPILGVHVFRSQVGRIVFGHAGPNMLHMVATDEDVQPEVKDYVERVMRKEILENRAALGWLAQPACVQPARVRFPGIALASLTGVPPINSVASHAWSHKGNTTHPVAYGVMDGPGDLTKDAIF